MKVAPYESEGEILQNIEDATKMLLLVRLTRMKQSYRRELLHLVLL